jgi:hypothetical protein
METLPTIILIQTEHNHWANRMTDHVSNRLRAVRFESTTPAHNNEIAMLCVVDNDRTGIPVTDRKTECYCILCPTYGHESIEKLAFPGWPLVLGLVYISR